MKKVDVFEITDAGAVHVGSIAHDGAAYHLDPPDSVLLGNLLNRTIDGRRGFGGGCEKNHR